MTIFEEWVRTGNSLFKRLQQVSCTLAESVFSGLIFFPQDIRFAR